MTAVPQSIRDVIDFTRNFGIRPTQWAGTIATWTDGAVDSFIRMASERLVASTLETVRMLQDQPEPFLVCAERRTRFDTQLLKRSLLYASRILRPVMVPDPARVHSRIQLRRFAALLGEALSASLPVMSHGVVLPVIGNLSLDEEPDSQLITLKSLMESKQVAALVEQDGICGLATGADLGNAGGCPDVFYCVGSFDGNTTGYIESASPTWGGRGVHPDALRNVALGKPDPDKLRQYPVLQECIDRAARERVAEVLLDWKLGSYVYRGSVISDSQTAWELFNAIAVEARCAQDYPTAKALTDVDLPFLDNVPVGVIMEQRAKHRDELAALRTVFDKFAIDAGEALAAGANQRDIRQLKEKHFDEPLRDLGRKLREANVQRYVEIAGCLGLVAGSVLIGALAGTAAPIVLADVVLGSAASLSAVKSLAKLLRERTALRSSPLHLLWKLKRSS